MRDPWDASLNPLACPRVATLIRTVDVHFETRESSRAQLVDPFIPEWQFDELDIDGPAMRAQVHDENACLARHESDVNALPHPAPRPPPPNDTAPARAERAERENPAVLAAIDRFWRALGCDRERLTFREVIYRAASGR